MQVILLEKIRNLGNLGDNVKVRAGFGRNFLIPQGKAVPATTANIKKFEARRAELEKQAAETLAAAKKRAEGLNDLVVTISAKAGDEGRLFGSVGTRDIAKAISDSGCKVEKSEIIMPEGLLRQTGEYEIFVQFHSDVRAPVKINIVSQA